MDSNGIDGIVLTSQLCRGLYPDGIINLDYNMPVTRPAVVYKGKNNENVLVVTDTSLRRGTEDQAFLEKLMAACGLTIDDIALVNIREQEVPLSEVTDQLKIRKCIFFGVPSRSIDFPIGEKEDTVMIYDDKYFIRTSPLSSLQYDIAKKKKLWHALKNMFGV